MVLKVYFLKELEKNNKFYDVLYGKNYISTKKKLLRAYGGCLGFWRRRRTW